MDALKELANLEVGDVLVFDENKWIEADEYKILGISYCSSSNPRACVKCCSVCKGKVAIKVRDGQTLHFCLGLTDTPHVIFNGVIKVKHFQFLDELDSLLE